MRLTSPTTPRSNTRIRLVFVALVFLTLFFLTYYILGYVKFATPKLHIARLSDGNLQKYGDGYGSKNQDSKAEMDTFPQKNKATNHKDENTSFSNGNHSIGTERKKLVKDVIGLMSVNNRSSNALMRRVDPKLIQKQIDILVNAMMSNSTMLDKPAETPQCMGKTSPTEVEDLLCIPKPSYLTDVKNPCWLESAGKNSNKKICCLPYFHILGVAKAGTTDLWNRLMGHPHVVSNDGLLHKEALWWSWRRYGVSGYRKTRPRQLNEYVELFQDTARQVETSLRQKKDYHKVLITGDGSPPDFWDFRGWRNISQNRGLRTPQVITPHLMRHLYRAPKFIFLFKDPIERLYSDYFFVGGGLTTLDFHNDVMATINMLASCVRLLGLKRCFFDQELYVKLPVRLPFACYSVYLREWLEVFPLNNFLFLKTEEYANDMKKTLKQVIKFLELEPLDEENLSNIAHEERSRITVQKNVAGPMMDETRAILLKLLGPCNGQLRALVKDNRFTWEGS